MAKPLFVLVPCFLLLTGGWAVVVFWQVQKEPFAPFDAWHYAFDTTTFRARIQSPEDEDLRNSTFFKVGEEIVTLLALLLLGWGYSITSEALEATRLRRLFLHEGGNMTWPEFLRKNEPALYEAFHGKPSAKQTTWRRFKKWLIDL